MKSCFTLIAALIVITVGADSASAYYHAGMGRFMQRDPHGTASAPIAYRPSAGVPRVRRGFVARDVPAAMYPDGMSLYAAYHLMHGGVDPTGLVTDFHAAVYAMRKCDQQNKPESYDEMLDRMEQQTFVHKACSKTVTNSGLEIAEAVRIAACELTGGSPYIDARPKGDDSEARFAEITQSDAQRLLNHQQITWIQTSSVSHPNAVASEAMLNNGLALKLYPKATGNGYDAAVVTPTSTLVHALQAGGHVAGGNPNEFNAEAYNHPILESQCVAALDQYLKKNECKPFYP